MGYLCALLINWPENAIFLSYRVKEENEIMNSFYFSDMCCIDALKYQIGKNLVMYLLCGTNNKGIL